MAKTSGSKKIRQKLLTLNDLAKYNRKVLFPALDDKFAKIDDKFAKIDDKFANIDKRFGKVGERFNKIDARFDRVDGEIEEKFNKIMVGQDKILKELEDIKSDNIAGLEAYKRHDEKIENHEKRIIIVERKLDIAAAR